MLHANIIYNENYKDDDLEKLNRTLKLIESTINETKFKNAVLNFKSFQFTSYSCLYKVRIKTFYLQEYTNEEIYNMLINGKRNEDHNSYMDLKVRLYDKRVWTAIGYTDSDNIITTYRSAFNNMNESQLAAHITHEWTHTLGFEHSYKKSCDPTRNCFSVPYAIGNIVEIILTGKCKNNCQYEI